VALGEIGKMCKFDEIERYWAKKFVYFNKKAYKI